MRDTLAELGEALSKSWPWLTPVALLAVTGLVRFIIERSTYGRTGPPDYHESDIARIYCDLRRDALARKPADSAAMDEDTVYGVVVDWGRPGGVATLTGFRSGDASLYFSRGGGVLGGIGHRRVREAAALLVEEAQKRVPWMRPADDGYPLPRIGRATFYVLTTRGVLSDNVRTDPIEANVAALWTAAQRLLSEVRTAKPHDPE